MEKKPTRLDVYPSPELRKALDRWRIEQHAAPSRAEAARQLLEWALGEMTNPELGPDGLPLDTAELARAVRVEPAYVLDRHGNNVILLCPCSKPFIVSKFLNSRAGRARACPHCDEFCGYVEDGAAVVTPKKAKP